MIGSLGVIVLAELALFVILSQPRRTLARLALSSDLVQRLGRVLLLHLPGVSLPLSSVLDIQR